MEKDYGIDFKEVLAFCGIIVAIFAVIFSVFFVVGATQTTFGIIVMFVVCCLIGLFGISSAVSNEGGGLVVTVLLFALVAIAFMAGDKTADKFAERHYDTMTTEYVEYIPVSDVAITEDGFIAVTENGNIMVPKANVPVNDVRYVQTTYTVITHQPKENFKKYPSFLVGKHGNGKPWEEITDKKVLI